MTATMWASEFGREGCLRLLIAAGANVEQQSEQVCECDRGCLIMHGNEVCVGEGHNIQWEMKMVGCCELCR